MISINQCARTLSVTVAALACAAAAVAQTLPREDLSGLALEDLLKVEIVSTASKFAQEVTRAPASITVVTGDEIRRFGYRSLPDVLRSVRGFYTTYDRNYSYIGVRGFARPGDYNSRVLLLVDGHRMNDALYDMAPFGTDFPVDLSLIDRIEVIRGPGSSLYGNNAFFAVVNVITRRGSDLPGTRVTGAGGSLGTRAANVSVGHLFDNGANLLVAATAYHSDGMTRLYYPEYDSPSSANGFARNMDDDGVHSMLGSLSIGAFSVRAGRGARDKDVPTAPFGTVFGDPSAHTRDIRTFADLKYEGRFTHGWRGLIRGSYDQYAYDSGWPYDYGDPIGVDTWRYLGRYDGLTTEIMANRALGSRHTLSLGTEWRGQLRLKQFTVDSLGVGLDDNRSALSWATFAQDEFAVTRRLLLNAGVRADRSPGHGIDASPRAGLVYLPADGTSLKLLYGRAFRAPNAYELFFYPSMREQRHTLEAETISTTEAVWEQYLGKRVRGSVSLFRSDIAGQISLASGTDSTGNDALFYENAGGATATGLETELEFRGPRGAIARASHASVRAADPDTRARLTNSPGHTAKFSAIAPLGRHGLFLSGEGQYVGRRLTVQGQPLDGFFIQNLNLTFDGPRGLELSAGIQNLSDTRYADPGSAEHMQAGITQDGRTLRVSASVRF